MRIILICAAVSILILSCSSSKSSDPDVDAWEREVEILTPAQITDRQYEELGGLLEEKVAIAPGYGSEEHAIDTARRRLRRRAAERDADAVVVFECGRLVRPVEQPSLADMGPEVVCHGAAIRWMD